MPYFIMDKSKTNFMELNHEIAMKLWVKTFGKEIKATDFSGRKIAKGAYNDRNSEFGWNVDHIFPQKLGGKTAEHNLIICNIKTNDEKADKFPGFVANGKRFTILKVENHYEIKPESKSSKKEDSKKAEEDWNLYDSASGLRLFKTFKGYQTKKRFVGTVEIILEGINGADTALTDFIETLFIDEDVQFVGGDIRYYSGTNVRMLVKNYELMNNDDISNLLEKCVLLNTYLSNYFQPSKIVNNYRICFRVDCYNDRKEFYSKDSTVRFMNKFLILQPRCNLYLNTLAIQNSYAKEKFDVDVGWNPETFIEYDYVLTNLSKNLRKELEG